MISVRHERLILRELLRLETADETAKLDNGTNIALMGPPFAHDEELGPSEERLPVLEFIFSRLIVTFPLFNKAKPNFWPETVQNFIQQLANADISSSADRDEATKRRRMARGIRRAMMMMLMAGLNTNSPKEETGRYVAARHGALQSEVAPPTELHKSKEEPTEPAGPVNLTKIQASVIGVTLSPGSMFRGSQHQFIVEAILPGHQVVWTLRTYSEFQAFDNALAKLFPGKKLTHFPTKNTGQSAVVLESGETVELPREHLREMLRNYLHSLAAYPQVTQSKLYLEFIAKNGIELNKAQIADVEARIEYDRQRWHSYTEFARIANDRAVKLERYLVEIKSEILLEDALPKIFFEMKAHDKIEDMSPLVQRLVEYCVVEVASIIHKSLISRDDSPELFSQIKRLHGLMPYKLMQGILMLSNPALIMKKMTDLFMATPFGSRSLLQKIFMNVLAEDSRSQGVLIEELKSVIKDNALCDAIQKYAWMGHCEREMVTSLADQTHTDLIVCIIEDSDLSHACKAEVRSWHSAWQHAVANSSAEQDLNKVEKYNQIKDFYKLVVRQRDKDILQEFWGEPQTMKIIKQVVDMLYGILIEIFRTANVSESVGDFERFVSDLIRVVERANGGLRVDANQMIEELIGVCTRHQNSVFKFINRVYSKDGGFFVEIVRWLTRIVNFVRHGKEGGNVIDIIGIVDMCDKKGTVNKEELVQELDALDEWLVLRKNTADETRSTAEIERQAELGKHFDVTDVGLTWDDVNYGYAEVERDEQEEFLDEEQLGQDAVTREKLRRKRAAQVAARQNSLPPRPACRELEKLVPDFKNELVRVFHEIDTSPSCITKGFT